MNTLIIVKIKNTTYDEWKKKFDADAEVQSQMMRNTIVVYSIAPASSNVF